jgi:hypothetical protein
VLTAFIVSIAGASCLTIGYSFGYRAGVNDTRAGLNRRGRGGRSF